MLFPDCCLHKKNKNDTVIIQSCKHKYKGGGGGGRLLETHKIIIHGMRAVGYKD